MKNEFKKIPHRFNLVKQFAFSIVINFHPKVAIIISFLLGYVILFLPWIYVTVQPIANTLYEHESIIYIIGFQDIPSIDNCNFSHVEWGTDFSQKMFQASKLFGYLLQLIPMYIWVNYLARNTKNKPISLITFFFACLLLLLIYTFILQQILPSEKFCSPVPIIQVTNISLYWPKILAWFLSSGFGVFSMYQAKRLDL